MAAFILGFQFEIESGRREKSWSLFVDGDGGFGWHREREREG
jgi:hypothetical protein